MVVFVNESKNVEIMDFILRKWTNFMEDGQFHGKWHGREI